LLSIFSFILSGRLRRPQRRLAVFSAPKQINPTNLRDKKRNGAKKLHPFYPIF